MYNYGNHSRDFTYIEDIVQGILKSTNKIPKYKRKFDYKNPRLAESSAPFTVYNIGNGKKVELMKYINEIEKYLNIRAKKKFYENSKR